MTYEEMKRQRNEGLNSARNSFYTTVTEVWSTYNSAHDAARATARALMGEEAWAIWIVCESEINEAITARDVAISEAQEVREAANTEVEARYDAAMWHLHKAHSVAGKQGEPQ